ncbi:hypothetical protein [Hyphomonas sp. UBA4494]|jgi:hypothetical protein|uniref:hypothetical protein n=1 Tax=Hyphomonas sp. UBA4494 TaxID=1946631 RepID=UPI0025BEC381|nr:hypothetical protein [Hyphomonas sp. UBA4494]
MTLTVKGLPSRMIGPDTEAERLADRLELSALYRQAYRHGRPSLFTTTISSLPRHAANITRQIGNSTVKTETHYESTPERALLKAIGDAEAWGLPLLDQGC